MTPSRPGRAAAGPTGPAALVLRPNDWETCFFGRRTGALEADAAALAALPAVARQSAVASAAARADAEGYRLVQLHLDIRFLSLAGAFEAAGFRLVDTRVEFLTQVDRRRAPRRDPPFGTAGLARPDDGPALRALAHEGLTANPAFQSRYKNLDYFTGDEAARWFAAWVEQDLSDPGTLLAVWRDDTGPVAFFGYARHGEHQGLPHFKSTLAVTAPHRQGHKAHVFLQTTLFDAMPADEFWVRGTTQLANAPIISNNLALGRHLESIALTFFRGGAG